MAAKKGHVKIGGRKKGTPNKSTKEIREAYQKLIALNTENMTDWLVRIAKKNPAKAFQLITDLSEFVLPKLARMEHAGDPEKPIEISYDLSKLSTETIKELISAGLLSKNS